MKYVLITGILSVMAAAASAQKLSLAGNWKVQLGSQHNKEYAVQLPGTLDDAGIGDSVHMKPALTIATLAHLSRKVQYVGKAYYSKSFTIPVDWKGGNFFLTLGRVLWKSSVIIDGNVVPEIQESLVSSHQYDISQYIKPGKQQKITLCIDNSNVYSGINIYATQYPSKESSEMAHSYTNHTQIKWNGVIGEISITRKQKIFVKHIYISPDPENGRLNLRYEISNTENKNYSVSSYVFDSKNKKKWNSDFKQSGLLKYSLQAELLIPNDAGKWDEFSPALYRLVTVVRSELGSDTLLTDFGIRNLAVKEANLVMNGNRLFLRNNLECIIFPLTGYPPMKVDEWTILFKKAKSYGLNSFRFHSWCPPEAAFAAADITGFYLQVELPHWNLKVGADTAAFNFLRREAFAILSQYGNHPSFLFFSMGNELEGDFSKLNNLVAELKAADRRHLYSTTTFTFQKEITGAPQPEDDFYVTQWTRKGWVRGQGIFNDQAPDFTKDFSAAMENINVPLISHEIGQYSVYPDMSEIKTYTGNLKPLNFIAVQNDLHAKGMNYLAPQFVNASGKLAALLYKAEIEMALKTKGMDGFQLLQLQDFPGQGTALVGLVNAFWKNKGFISPSKFRSFCSEVTPLIRFPKVIYSNRENFSATVELANFFRPLIKKTVYWKIKNAEAKVLASGNFISADYAVGNGLEVGQINFALNNISEAAQLTIEVGIESTAYQNDWRIWVYPEKLNSIDTSIVVTGSLHEAIAALEAGKKVLLCPVPDTLKGITGKFVPVFWSPVHFPDQPGTMGLLIKNKSSAFRYFPTDENTDWQWWDLTRKSKSLIMNKLPEDAILIRVIDNFVRNQSLSNLFEGKSGKGKLVFCSIDIMSDLENRLAARQLRYSLLQYMGNAGFNPKVQLKPEALGDFFK